MAPIESAPEIAKTKTAVFSIHLLFITTSRFYRDHSSFGDRFSGMKNRKCHTKGDTLTLLFSIETKSGKRGTAEKRLTSTKAGGFRPLKQAAWLRHRCGEMHEPLVPV